MNEIIYLCDEVRDEYKMEFCDETLRKYIGKRNNKLAFATRKRITLQFLYGINYIHGQGLLHRDLSLQNVLLKVFESGAALVKLSDFGLVKDRMSDFTRTKTEMRGTIRDRLLASFKDYDGTHPGDVSGVPEHAAHDHLAGTVIVDTECGARGSTLVPGAFNQPPPTTAYPKD